jgi:GNAT superfamily N-acetyltransferase
MTPCTVRLATLADLAYVEALRAKEKRAIGFMTPAAYAGVITQQGLYRRPNARLWLAEVDGEGVGFLYATPGEPGGSLCVVQVCLQRDARRREYGTALVETAEGWAQALQRPGVKCRVKIDLEARAFWDALGYRVAGTEYGGRRLGANVNGHALERRYKALPCGLLLPQPDSLERGG